MSEDALLWSLAPSLSLNGHMFKSQHVSGEEESYVELKKIHRKLDKQTI